MCTQSPPYTQSRANAATLRNLHHMCLGSCHRPSPLGRADCMCLHGRPCVWLPFAAACCYTLFYLLMMPAARLVCQRPSSNFPYFRTPLANFLLSRQNSVEYGNSKRTWVNFSGRNTVLICNGKYGNAFHHSNVFAYRFTLNAIYQRTHTYLALRPVFSGFVLPGRPGLL